MLSASLLSELGQIAWFIVLPLLLLIAVGFAVQRVLGLDLTTLTRINFYVTVPAMVYWSLVDSGVTLSDAGRVIGFSLLAMVAWGVAALVLAAIRGVPHDQRRALLMTSIFHNAGNYGLPLQELAFRHVNLSAAAMSLQVFVMIAQNIISFTVGVVLAAGELRDGRWRANLLHVLRFPPVYALAAAGITIALRTGLGEQAQPIASALQPVWETIVYAKNGFVVVALITLGAQLATVNRGHTRYPVTLSVVLRLLVGPAVGLGLIWLLGIEGLLAHVLLISTATPTSVNCMLLCLEFDNHPDFVARSVFYTTVLSPITVTAVILLTRTGIVGGL